VSDTQPGPDWWQASDGRWYEPESHPGYQTLPEAGYPISAKIDGELDVVDRPSAGASLVAVIFKLGAVLAGLAGIFAAVVVGFGTTSMSTSDTAAVAVGIGVGGIFVGAGLAFFGYVLELLVGVKIDLGVLSYLALASDDEES
jgi:hypothetical protein